MKHSVFEDMRGEMTQFTIEAEKFAGEVHIEGADREHSEKQQKRDSRKTARSGWKSLLKRGCFCCQVEGKMRIHLLLTQISDCRED